MEHIKIEQNSNVEVVDSNIIHKLAEEAQDCDASSNMTGNLQTTNAYEDDVDFLTTKFPGLSINATQGLYLRIADPAVQNILATNFGDGTGITKAQAQSLQHFNSKFANNTDIETFDELSKFTNITEINSNNRFNSCTNLKSIDLSNITKISGSNGYERWNFEFCSNLEDVGDTSNCTYFGYGAFNQCGKLTRGIDLTNAIHIGDSAFYKCANLTAIGSIQNIEHIGSCAFRGCYNIPSFNSLILPNLTGMLESEAFAECTQIVNVENLGTITTVGGTGSWDPFMMCDNLETIVVPETVTTINYLLNYAPKVRWVKMLCNTVPTVPLDHFGMFGESWNPYRDRTGTYIGKTYPIYVKDSLYNTYLQDSFFSNLASRIRPLSQFATDFPNG